MVPQDAEGPPEGSNLFPSCPAEGDPARGVFPVGRIYEGPGVEIARKAVLPVSDKSESQDICFIPRGCAEFLHDRGVRVEPGEIVDQNGKTNGRHRGIACYTIGQRGGLGISSPRPLYVLAIDAARNRLIVGEKGELKSGGLIADRVNRSGGCFSGGAA